MKVPSVCHDLPLVQALKSDPGNYPDVKPVAVKMEMDTGDWSGGSEDHWAVFQSLEDFRRQFLQRQNMQIRW